MHFKLLKGEAILPSGTFIIGCPSHGNLAQLALDCTISTLAKKNAVRRIGICESALLVPMTGYEQYCEEWGNTLCAPIELYQVTLAHASSPIYLVLQRSPCFEHAISSYAQELVNWICDFTPASVILLAGCSNNAILDIAARYIHLHGSTEKSSSGQLISAICKNSTMLPTTAILAASQDPDSPLSFLDMDIPLAVLQAATSVPATLVGCCCEEGINFSDGKLFGEKLLKAMEVEDDVVIPQSWQVLLQPPPLNDFGMMY